MKTMTCNQLGGACDLEFHAETFDDMANQSQKHGAEMHQQADEQHMVAMDAMSDLMKDQEAMQQWMSDKKNEFDALPDDK